MQFVGVQQHVDQVGVDLDHTGCNWTEDYLCSVYRLQVLSRRHHVHIAFDVLAHLVRLESSLWPFKQQHGVFRFDGVGNYAPPNLMPACGFVQYAGEHGRLLTTVVLFKSRRTKMNLGLVDYQLNLRMGDRALSGLIALLWCPP